MAQRSRIYKKQSDRTGLYLDPRTKLAFCIGSSMILLTGGYTMAGEILKYILAAVPLFLLQVLKDIKKAAYYGGIYLICCLLPQLLVAHLPFAVNLFFTGIVAFFTKILPSGMLFYLVFRTTSVSEFVAAMDRMHVKRSFSAPISVMFRLFPTIVEEYHAVSDAMALRKIGSFRNPVEMLEYRMVPFLTSVVSIGNDLSASALTRGLDAPYERTSLCPIGFTWRDVLVFAALFVVAGIHIYITCFY